MASCLWRLALTVTFLVASAVTATGQVPSQEEMRQRMVAAGMSPEQIDQALATISKELSSLGFEASSVPTECEDENANDVCDSEEDDPVIRECRSSYVNAIVKVATDNYGSRLGTTAGQIAQTCSTAAVGGTLYFGHEAGGPKYQGTKKAWYHDKERLFETGEYWRAILSYNNYLSDSKDEEIDLTDQQLDAIVKTLPRDLRAMLGPFDENENGFYEAALPIHNRCENIRRLVGESFRHDVLDSAVCVPVAPEPNTYVSGGAE